VAETGKKHGREVWETLGNQDSPSWYLHPLVARQKRDVYVDLIRRWTQGRQDRTILKTDLFEEAFGGDYLLPGLFPEARLVCGMDSAFSTARRAALRHESLSTRVAVMDAQTPAWGAGRFDLILSTSTLDHFEERAEFIRSIVALAELLRPGGLLILTLDNPLNPLYHLLRRYSRRKAAPFPLGYTPGFGTLCSDLRACGLEIGEDEWILHNPRGLSTLLFVGLQKLFGRRADGLVKGCLRTFELLGRLPTRRFTACFQSVAVYKPVAVDAPCAVGGGGTRTPADELLPAP
jgi:SAM-dependent methyltransferase